MANENTVVTPSHSGWMKAWETIQNVGIALAVFMGARNAPAKDEQLNGKEIPGWIMNAFPSLTREDENEYAIILSSYPDPTIEDVEATFRQHFIADGYNEDKYRTNIVLMRREYTERMSKSMPKNEPGMRMTFQPLEMKDPVDAFLTKLITENGNGGTPQEVYERQKKAALNRKILEKNGVIACLQQNKANTIVIVIGACLWLLVVLAAITFFA